MTIRRAGTCCLLAPTILSTWIGTAEAHMISPAVGDFYAGVLHPLTSAEHLLPLLALAVLAAQGGQRAVRRTLVALPLALALGVLGGARLPASDIAFAASALGLIVAGFALLFPPGIWERGRAAAGVMPVLAVVMGLALGWRSGGDMAASTVSWRFVPGVAVTGFALMVLAGAWMPRLSTGWRGGVRLALGGFFAISGVLAGLGLFGAGPGVVRLPGFPSEKTLADVILVSSDPGTGMVVAGLFAALAWGAAHALTPGHGKALVGAYLVGANGTVGQALALGATVTATHTLGVYLLGAAASLAAGTLDRERLSSWLALCSGLGVTAIGAMLFRDRWVRHGRGDRALPGATHSHGGISHSHGGVAHTHGGLAPAGHAGEKTRWRRLLALGVSGGLVPCPAALVLMLGAIAIGRIGLGLLLVAAFSLGLAGMLTLVGILFLKGAAILGHSARFGRAVRWMPVGSALVVSLLGVLLVWAAVSRLFAG